MNLPEDYLSPEKRVLVDEYKKSIREGKRNHRSMGFLTDQSTTVANLIWDAIVGDEQGPWSVEEPYTEIDLARYELALEAWEARIRAEVREELRAEIEAEVRAELEG